MPSLRIALLTCSTRPPGGAVRTLALAEALAAAGQEVDVWALADAEEPEFFRTVDVRVRVRPVPVPDLAGEGTVARVLRSIGLLAEAFAAASQASHARRDGQDGRDGHASQDGQVYDVVHAQDWICAAAVPGRLRTVQHFDRFAVAELAVLHRRGLLEPTALICPSAAVALELQVETGRTASVIPTGVQAGRFAAAALGTPEALAARDHWSGRFGGFVLAVGGVGARKGTLDLVRAMARVRRRRPGTRLVLAGGDLPFDGGEYRREVDALATRLRIEPVLLGVVDHEDLPALVAAAGVFAVASGQEGSGVAALEALAAGRPVVVRDLPVSREMMVGAYADQGAGGELVRLADGGDGSSADVAAGLAAQLTAALEQPPGAASRAEPADTWDDVAAAHLAHYRRLINEGYPIGTGEPAGQVETDGQPGPREQAEPGTGGTAVSVNRAGGPAMAGPAGTVLSVELA